MHESVMQFLRDEILGSEISGQRVLEVGSYDVNGSPRKVLIPMNPAEYVGVDQGPGPGVDVVLDAGKIVQHFGPGSFDVVVSTEMLEHALDWRTAVTVMKRVLRPDGLLILTTRGPGMPYHGFPDDHWRFTQGLMVDIFGDMKIYTLRSDPQLPGVLLKARMPALFFEADLSKIEPLKAPPRP